jgi:hypothetical protein
MRAAGRKVLPLDRNEENALRAKVASQQIELLLATMRILELQKELSQSLHNCAPSVGELVRASQAVVNELGWGG